MNVTVDADYSSVRLPGPETARHGHIHPRPFIESESEAVVLHDGETIHEVNHRAAELFGYYREDMLRRTLYQLLSPASHRCLKQWLEAETKHLIALFGQHRSGRVFNLYFKPLACGRFNGNHVVVTILTGRNLLGSGLNSFSPREEGCNASPE